MVSQETGDKIQRKRKDDGRVLLRGDAVESLKKNHGFQVVYNQVTIDSKTFSGTASWPRLSRNKNRLEAVKPSKWNIQTILDQARRVKM